MYMRRFICIKSLPQLRWLVKQCKLSFSYSSRTFLESSKSLESNLVYSLFSSMCSSDYFVIILEEQHMAMAVVYVTKLIYYDRCSLYFGLLHAGWPRATAEVVRGWQYGYWFPFIAAAANHCGKVLKNLVNSWSSWSWRRSGSCPSC